MKQLVVLITGASAGLGKELAKVLASQGHRVYAGARRLDRMEELKNFEIFPIAMDVTKEQDCTRVVEEILVRESRIDVLVNNAGFGLWGAIEDVSMDNARYQFEVNLFGLAFLTKCVLPHMRSKTSGRIINVSSIGGKVYTPLAAWYHATKHALEGWSDCLRLEVKPFGIDVVIVEPGAVHTEFGDVVAKGMEELPQKTAYSSMLASIYERRKNPRFASTKSSINSIVATMAKAVNSPRPKLRYVAGSMSKPLLLFRKFFGDRAYDSLLFRMLR